MNKTIRIVQGGFAAIFGLTIISVIIRGIKENIPIWAEILLIFVSLVSIGGLVILYQKLKAKKLTEKQSDRIFFIIAGLMLIIQIIFAVILCYKPWSDLGFVDKAARDFCLTWDKKDLYTHLPERHENYFVRYTNNQAILIILSVIYSVCNTVLGKMPYLVPVMINTFGLNISVILMYFTAKKIFRNPTTALFTGIFMLTMFFFNAKESPAIFYALSGLTQFFFSGFNTAIYAIIPDCVEYGEWKTGLRNDGFQYAFISLGNKIGMAVGTALLAGLLGKYGYIANQTQNAIVLSIMKHAFTTIPGVLWIVTAVVLFFYRLNKKRYNEIVEELKNGRKS